MNLIFKNFSKKYDEYVYQDINKEISIDGITCLVGESGSGKSTLINLITGFDTDYEGEIYLTGESDIKIGFMPQSDKLLDELSVFENIMSFTTDAELIEDKLKQFNLSSFRDQKVVNLSGGQRQRVNLIRATMGNPNLIILDEPSSSLDKEMTIELYNYLEDLRKSGINFLIVTHDKILIDLVNNQIRVANKNLECEIKASNKQNRSKILPNFLNTKYFSKSVINNNKIKYFINIILVTVILSMIAFISILMFSKINVFTENVNSFFGPHGGQISNLYYNDVEDGECNEFIYGELCASGHILIPGAHTFTEEEVAYLQAYEGFETLYFSYTANNGYNRTTPVDGEAIDLMEFKKREEAFYNETGDDDLLNVYSYPVIMPVQTSEYENIGNIDANMNDLLEVKYGELHDLAPNEVVISEQTAEMIAWEQNIPVEEVVGTEITFDTCVENFESIVEKESQNYRGDSRDCENSSTYTVAWIYENDIKNPRNLMYFAPYELTDEMKQNYNYIPKTSELMYLLDGNDEFLNNAVTSIQNNYIQMQNSETFPDKDSEALVLLIEDYSSLENLRNSIGTGYETVFYTLKTGYSYDELQVYIDAGPETLKYRKHENPEYLLENENYNHSDNRFYIILGMSMLLLSILIIIILNFVNTFRKEIILLKSMKIKNSEIKKVIGGIINRVMVISSLVTVIISIIFIIGCKLIGIDIIIYFKDIVFMLLEILAGFYIAKTLAIKVATKVDARKELHE